MTQNLRDTPGDILAEELFLQMTRGLVDRRVADDYAKAYAEYWSTMVFENRPWLAWPPEEKPREPSEFHERVKTLKDLLG